MSDSGLYFSFALAAFASLLLCFERNLKMDCPFCLIHQLCLIPLFKIAVPRTDISCLYEHCTINVSTLKLHNPVSFGLLHGIIFLSKSPFNSNHSKACQCQIPFIQSRFAIPYLYGGGNDLLLNWKHFAFNSVCSALIF